MTDGISRQAKITYSPRSDRWPDLLATNDNVTCICPRSYHCGNKQRQHDRAMHPCITLRTFRTKTTCTRDKNSIYKERGSEPPLSVSSCMSALPPARRRQYRSPPSVSKAHDFPHARSNAYVATNCRSGRHGNRRRELSAAATSGSQMQSQIDSVAAPMMGC